MNADCARLRLTSAWHAESRLTTHTPVKFHFLDPPFPAKRVHVQYIALAKDRTFQPGPYAGVELLILHKNRAPVAWSFSAISAGVTVPAHVHPLANEHVYVLSGEWEESGIVYGAGSFSSLHAANAMARTWPTPKS